ncbi:MAG: hypothetical protein F2660_05090 [Actinobacteria bacterium]|uniref:Unannotated protein n=1 Tax=freshwater metagenome TaxID=449393 RepID=A0A6J6NZB2_9ZZZZ|nr:hypothetical protein [Actinomycetota bacterium]
MSNKLTRKSLAFGALVALASSVIAGAPAQASDQINVAPTAGTTYTTFTTETFTVATSFAPGFAPADYGQLKYEVASSAAIRTGVAIGATTAAATAAVVLADTALTSGKAVITPVSPNIGTATSVRVLGVAIGTAASLPTATTANQTVSVTAFVDANNDGALTAGEWSETQTITFKKYADLAPTVALTPVLAGDASVKATATYPAELNTAMLTAADFKVTFTVAGASGVAAAPGVAAASGVYTDDGLTVVNAAAAVTAQANYKGVTLGTAVTGTVAAATVASVTGALVTSADAAVISSVNTVRLNSAFSVNATLRGAVVAPATVGPVVANKAATAAVSGFGTLSTTRTLSINGTVYNSNANVPASIALTSDANGVVTLNFKTVGFSAGAAVSVVVTSDNIPSAAVAVVQAATAYAITADRGNLYSTPLGTPVTIALSVNDQFGTPSTLADRISITPTGTFTGYVAPATSFVMVSGGKASFTVSSLAATAAGQISVATALQELNPATQNYDAYNPAVAGTAILVNVTTAANSFTTAPAATATARVTDQAFTSAIATGDTTDNATYSVVVANPGTPVTVAAPGAYISANGTFGTGTVTVNSPANGTVAVTVWAQKVGSLTVTFTNGVAVRTSVVTVTTNLLPALVSLDAPAQAQVGQALDVVITVTDRWGNPVPTPTTGTDTGILTVSSTGTGYFASSAPVANAAGKATVKYIVGTADIGTAFLSATLDLATNVTGARSIEFGLTDGDVLAGGKRVFVSAEFAKGRTVSVSINGKRIYSKVQTTDNAVELAFTQRRAGTYTVTVRISGGIVFTEKVTVG